jgi:hypothetical protein
MSVEKGEEPVTDGDLEAEVVFGDPDSDTRSAQIVLDPSDEAPGQYFGGIIPTRPGTYSFHITGTAGGQTIDEMFISGEQTFDDVINPAEAEFPEQDPTNGELSEAIDRLSARIDESGGGATADDQTALWIAIGSGVLALIALIAALRRRPPA